MTGEDFRTPQVEGRRPAGFGLICRYIDGVHRVKRFFEVVSLLAPPASLMAPEIVTCSQSCLFAALGRRAAGL